MTIKEHSTLDRIASIRAEVNALAALPDVLEMICAGGYHPDVRLGDAIQALDELAFALNEFNQNRLNQDDIALRYAPLHPLGKNIS